MLVGWFPVETHETLKAYRRHCVTAGLVSYEIYLFEALWFKEDGGIERLNRLSTMREREPRAMIACSRSLRIAKSAQTKPETAYRDVRNARRIHLIETITRGL